MALLEEIGAPAGSLQVAQGSAAPWWRPGRSARLQLGPKAVLAEFGALHPTVLKALDVEGPVYGFEIWLEAIPEPKRKAVKTRPALELSPLMPLTRDFAFVVDEGVAAGDLVRAVQGADKALIAGARVFDVYAGPGVRGGIEVAGGRGDDPAARQDPDRRRDRGPVGQDRRRGGKRRSGPGCAAEPGRARRTRS